MEKRLIFNPFTKKLDYIRDPKVNEQYIKDILTIGEEWSIIHSEDANFTRLIQVFRDLLNTDVSLDFDGIDEANFTQENSGKTDFVGDKLQLESIGEADAYAQYHLNEFSGTEVPDCSGNNRHGTAVNINDTNWVAGKLNNCLYIESDEYINLADIANFERSNSFSLECWIKTLNYAGWKNIIMRQLSEGSYTGWTLAKDTNHKIAFKLVHDGTSNYLLVNGNTSIGDDTWHHIVVTYDGSSSASGVKIYVDGSLETMETKNDTLSDSILNSANCKVVPMYKNRIDEIVIYDKELTQEEVSYRYNSGNGREGGFDTSKGWYVLTNTNQLITSTWESIVNLSIAQSTPVSTELRYLVSVDNRTSWKRWNGVSWDAEVLVNLYVNGNTKAELEGLSESDWNLLFSLGTFDIAIGLKTADGSVTPSIDQITINYKLIGKQKCKDSEIEVITLSSTQTRIKNISGNILQNLRVAIAL